MKRPLHQRAAWPLLAICCFVLALCPAIARGQGEQPPFVVTPAQVVDRMLSMAKLGPDDVLIDLGSGDGRIVIEAAKRFGARGLGIEMNASLVETSRAAARREGVAERARFERGDALTTDLGPASVVTLYLSPELNERLLPRILAALRPGSRVVSHDFAISNWAPDRTERLNVPEKNNGRGGESVVMLWIVPANAAGRWRGAIGHGAPRRAISQGAASRAFEFSLGQQFQFLEGGLHGPTGATLAFKASLSGDRITLQLPAQGAAAAGEVHARIAADAMTGTWVAADGAVSAPFEARRIAARPDLY
ncbi:MAG: methyltransferase domain-containing protein [Betaproteobacteria bacterium]|nr:methyltransferase domain-containing protein [Betaproteobacteria bacterium]